MEQPVYNGQLQAEGPSRQKRWHIHPRRGWRQHRSVGQVLQDRPRTGLNISGHLGVAVRWLDPRRYMSSAGRDEPRPQAARQRSLGSRPNGRAPTSRDLEPYSDEDTNEDYSAYPTVTSNHTGPYSGQDGYGNGPSTHTANRRTTQQPRLPRSTSFSNSVVGSPARPRSAGSGSSRSSVNLGAAGQPNLRPAPIKSDFGGPARSGFPSDMRTMHGVGPSTGRASRRPSF